MKKNIDILEHILTYCKDIEAALERFGGMRNLFAHNYGAVDVGLVWETAVSDIPVLHAFCEQTIRMFRFLEQEGEETDYGIEH